MPGVIKAVYRDRDGASEFTGLVTTDGRNFKFLHDLSGDLEGEAHEATASELTCIFSTYDGSHFQPPPLVDTEHVPELVVGEFADDRFPVGDPAGPDRVRAGDDVKVRAVGPFADRHGTVHVAREAFWVLVVSVTTHGLATGIPLAKLHCLPIGPDEPISFRIDKVLKSRHGENRV